MKRIKYVKAPAAIDEAISTSEAVEDFLPRPSELVFKEESVKITLELSKRSVRLFKQYAAKKGVKYQRMIRNLVDRYAEKALTQ